MKVTRLLVIRLSALGDVIHTIPAVDVAPRSAFDVSWVVEAAYAELVEIVAGVKPIPVRLKKWSLAETGNAWRSVRGFDAAIDFQGLIKSALIARASGARERYGFAREAVREKPAAMFYNHKVSVDQTKHVVDWNMQLAGFCGGAGASPSPTEAGHLSTEPDWSAVRPGRRQPPGKLQEQNRAPARRRPRRETLAGLAISRTRRAISQRRRRGLGTRRVGPSRQRSADRSRRKRICANLRFSCSRRGSSWVPTQVRFTSQTRSEQEL